MFNIIFYKDRKGNEPVKEFLVSLFENDSKENRIKREKILDYMGILEKHGKRAGYPFVKHLDGEIWELRPMKERIMFFSCINDEIVLLSHFRKKTQKTPKREIEKAKKLMKDYIERR